MGEYGKITKPNPSKPKNKWKFVSCVLNENNLITWKIDTFTLNKLIFKKIKYWLKRHIMKYFARKSQNGCSLLAVTNTSWISRTFRNDDIQRFCGKTFKSYVSELRFIPTRAVEDENLQTDRLLSTDLTPPSWSICYWPHSVIMDQMEAGSNSSQQYPCSLYWNTIHFFCDATNTTCCVIVPQFPPRSPQIPVDRMPIVM